MKSVEKVKITEAQLKEAEEMLNKKGESVKVGRSLFNPSGTRRYTLREAIEFAKKGRLTSKIVIPEDRYAELVALYVKYSYSTKWDGVCKTLNTKFFDPTNKLRLAMSEFTNRLKQAGWNFESTHKRTFTEKKVAEDAKIKAQRTL